MDTNENTMTVREAMTTTQRLLALEAALTAAELCQFPGNENTATVTKFRAARLDLEDSLAKLIEGESWTEEMPFEHYLSLQHSAVKRLADNPQVFGAEVPDGISVLRFVHDFADLMVAKLAANRHKGDRAGWLSDGIANLLHKLTTEVGEFVRAIASESSEAVKSEAADVGNFAMMIADAHANGQRIRTVNTMQEGK